VPDLLREQGLGTFEELCEVLTWTQLGLQRKPCGLLDVEGYYRPLLALFDGAVAEGFLRPEHRALALADTDAARLLDRLAAAPVVEVEEWIGREER
jgi:predicted Rossmann-fold nucleotide-binding protein